MTFRHLNQGCQKLIFLVFVCMLPLAANGSTEDVINEKRTKVAMRMIGHEVLKCFGDYESRIMPIEKINGHYKIPFEFEFGFDPDDMINIVEDVMTKTGIATNYIVEVEQCETKKVVHSFQIGNTEDSDIAACSGRVLPKDCYNLLVTILDGTDLYANLLSVFSGKNALTLAETKEASFFKSSFLIVALLLLIAFASYFIRKKKPQETNTHLVRIGASQFDKRNMALSFENKRVELSNKESELLSLLHTAANTPIEREVILERVWGDEGDYVGRTLDVFISKLRRKLEADESVKIVNIRGVGYKLVVNG